MADDEHLRLAEHYISAGHGHEAIEALRHADPTNPRSFLLRSRALIQTGDFEEATSQVLTGLELAPESIDLLKILAILQNEHDPAEAEATIRRALKINPDDVEANNIRAIVLARTGRHDAAEVALRTAMSIDPEGSQAARVMLLLARREPADARDAARQMIADAPESALAHHLLGTAYLQCGATLRAIRHLHLAASLAPEDVTYAETARVMRSWYLWPAYFASGYKSSLLLLLAYASCFVTEYRGSPQVGVNIFWAVLSLIAYQFVALLIARVHLQRRVKRAQGR